MADRARDIQELADLLDGAESDERLSNQAIEIHERLIDEKSRARHKNDGVRARVLVEQEEDFCAVKKEIMDRRHSRVLEKYTEWCKRNSQDPGL